MTSTPNQRSMVTFNKEEQEAKKELDVTWRYLIKKGIFHCKECIPRQEELMYMQKKITNYKDYVDIAHYIRDHYPKIWDEMKENGVRKVN